MSYKIDGENLIFVDGESGRGLDPRGEIPSTFAGEIPEVNIVDERKKFPEQCLMCGNKNIIAWFTCKACGLEWRITGTKKENP
jgi:hypothetical protein